MSQAFAQRARPIALSLMLAMLAAAIWPPDAAAESEVDVLKRALVIQSRRLQALEAGKPHDFVSIRVNPGGKKEDAENYYKEIAPLINFQTLLASDLNGLLAYLGFEGLQAADLELLASDVLMPKSKADFDRLASEVSDPNTFKSKRSLHDFAHDKVLVSRFFAPKIVNFDAPPNTDAKQNPYNAGWRKLVRIVPLAKSDAEKGNIGQAYILFNYFQRDVEKDPFPQKADGIKPETQSVNNQIILVPKKRKSKDEDAAFWIVYQPNLESYKLGFALNAAFDVIDPGSGKTRDYFVPTACAQCHGHDEINDLQGPAPRPFKFAKTNYLDTDQWYDMVEFDFPGTKDGKADVIFDGGKDHKAKKYVAAVGVVAKLNRHILRQNEESARPNKSDRFKVLAVKKWLRLHKSNPEPISLFKRSIGTQTWDKNKVLDAKLLPQLDRFCFRCHSTVRFDVFDRAKVKGNAFLASLYVGVGAMPQGRRLSGQELADLVKLLDELDAEK
jgi:hypothetical protein